MIKRILKSNLFKNFSYLTLGEVVSKAIGFFVAVYIARVLGPDNFGKLGFAQAFTSYFGLIVNLGFDVYGAREIAKDKSKAKELLSNIVVMKFFLFILAYALLFLVVNFLPKDAYTKKVILLYGLSLFTSVLAIDWFFQGFENFKIIAIGRIIRNVVYAVLVFSFIRYQYQLMEFIGIQILSAVVGAAVLWGMSYSFFSFKAVDLAKWKDFGKTGFILASSFFMISIYYNLDKVMIGFWFPDKYVGWYEVAYRIVMASLILSGIIWNIFLPKITNFDRSLFLYLKIMVFVGFIFLVSIFAFSSDIISTIFGIKYLPASKALRILAFNVFFVYVNVAFISPIMLWNEKKYFLAIGSGGVTNIIFNFLLIPKYNIIGASIATVLAEVSVFLVGIIIFIKIFKENYKRTVA